MEIKSQNIGEYVDIRGGLESKYLSHSEMILAAYSCHHDPTRNTDKKIVGLDVVLEDSQDYPNEDVLVFRETWLCDRASYRRVEIKLPNELRFRPDLVNNVYYPHNYVKVRIWMMPLSKFARKRRSIGAHIFDIAEIRMEFQANIKPPFSRPSILSRVCLNFASEILHKSELKSIYQCPYEQETIKLLEFPLALTGNVFGKIAQFKPYENSVLERRRLIEYTKFRYIIDRAKVLKINRY